MKRPKVGQTVYTVNDYQMKVGEEVVEEVKETKDGLTINGKRPDEELFDTREKAIQYLRGKIIEDAKEQLRGLYADADDEKVEEATSLIVHTDS